MDRQKPKKNQQKPKRQINRHLRAGVPSVYVASIVYDNREIPEELTELLDWRVLQPRLNEWIHPKDPIALYFAPPRQTVFYELYTRSRMTLRQLIALDTLITCGMKARGSSHGMTGHVGERVDTSSELKAPEFYQGSRHNRAHQMFEHVHKGLHLWQRLMLNDLLTMQVKNTSEQTGRALMRGKGTTLGAIGHYRCNYQEKGKQSYAAGAGYVHAILDSIADLFEIK